MPVTRTSSPSTLVLVFVVALAAVVQAQDPLARVKQYDGIQAGQEAYAIAEAQRQAGVNQQVFANDQMRFWNGYPTSRGETIYYGYMSPATAAFYGYSAYGPWTGFQPGPWMGSGLLGSGAYYQPARQPIGQQQIQIGPNHWESHPVYDPPLTIGQPQPPVSSPLLEVAPPVAPALPAAPAAAPPPAVSPENVPPPPPPAARPPVRVPREV